MVLNADIVEYYCFEPKYHPGRGNTTSGESIPRKRMRLYLLMGSSYIRVSSLPAGNICAIYGLEEVQLKSVTICDVEYGMPLKVFDRGVRHLVKVSVEPISVSGKWYWEKEIRTLI